MSSLQNAPVHTPVPTAPESSEPNKIQESDSVPKIKSFDEMPIRGELLRGIYGYGFEHPSTIQSKAIVPMASDSDLLAQAQSGTGKTGTYSIGLLQRVKETQNTCQALVLAPTRELVDQVNTVVTDLGKYIPNLRVRQLVGGTSVRNDIDALRKGVHVVVGTPGRVLDMITRGVLKTDAIRTLVLDEADAMLSAGFRDAIYDIFTRLPSSVKCGIFSATFPTEALEISSRFLRDPIRVVIPQEEVSLRGIKQYHVDVEDPRWKLDTLCDLFDALSVSQTVIFVNTRRTADWLFDQMRSRDFPVSLTHAQMSSGDRAAILADFRRGKTRVLISTDLLARGIDVHGVSVVINYDLPTDIANYIHRIGRSGRFGRKGVAISLIARQDYRMIRDLEDYYATSIPALPQDVVLEL